MAEQDAVHPLADTHVHPTARPLPSRLFAQRRLRKLQLLDAGQDAPLSRLRQRQGDRRQPRHAVGQRRPKQRALLFLGPPGRVRPHRDRQRGAPLLVLAPVRGNRWQRSPGTTAVAAPVPADDCHPVAGYAGRPAMAARVGRPHALPRAGRERLLQRLQRWRWRPHGHVPGRRLPGDLRPRPAHLRAQNAHTLLAHAHADVLWPPTLSAMLLPPLRLSLVHLHGHAHPHARDHADGHSHPALRRRTASQTAAQMVALARQTTPQVGPSVFLAHPGHCSGSAVPLARRPPAEPDTASLAGSCGANAPGASGARAGADRTGAPREENGGRRRPGEASTGSEGRGKGGHVGHGERREATKRDEDNGGSDQQHGDGCPETA